MTPDRSLRTFVVGVVIVLSALASLSFASTAGATTKCGKLVFLDWYDNGRIDKLYPLNCYEEAIDAIPADIRDYADAEDIITRALQGALHGDLVAGGCDPTPDTPDEDCTRQPGGSSTGNGKGGDDPSGESSSTGEDPGQVAPGVDTSSPSSVPIPLLVLGGMSILLLAAGGLGYLSRRRNAAHADEFGDDDPLV